MRAYLEAQFHCRILAWDEPTDDLGGVQYRALVAGRLVVADSLALLISELYEARHQPVVLMAA